jgi:hypothetical protein
MTTKEEIILDTILRFLGKQSEPQSEPMIHGATEIGLGAIITVNELQAVLQLANQKHLAIGLPGGNGKLRWSVSDTGRHYLANK